MKKVACCATLLLLLTSSFAFAQQYKVIHSFSGAPSGDGANPFSGLIRDNSGNLYGATGSGGTLSCGTDGCGTVYELSPGANGNWTETVLYLFCQSGPPCLDGEAPNAPVVMDAKGNLYGTTSYGGNGFFGTGEGVAYELSPPQAPGGTWTETVLYNFCSVISGNTCLDGSYPFSPLVFDSAGNLYGTTLSGGANDRGEVFEFSPNSSGWTETVLYNFCADIQGHVCVDGSQPYAGVIFDKSGNLYGATSFGGSISHPKAGGTLYKLVPGSNGWTETVLVDFAPPGGTFPNAQLSFDASGNLYGPLGGGGTRSDGAVFQYNPANTKLHQLSFNGSNGQGPDGPVLVDPLHRGFFGTTTYGGVNNPGSTWNGTAYQISPSGKETVLYNFCSQPAPNCTDGANPMGNLVEDSAGNLYGTTESGGANNVGVVFEITP